jgi:hypothetical protein
MGKWAGAGEARYVRIWPLVALAVGSALWPAAWWWSQLRGAQEKVEDSDDTR